MGVRNVLILFFSAMAVSMVILIVFFSLFFKNFDNLVTFDTKLPESAPDLGSVLDKNAPAGGTSRSDGLEHSTINVPSDSRSRAGAGLPGVVIPNNNPPAAGAGLPADVTDPESIPDPATDPSAAPLDPATRPETTSPSATEPAKKPVKKPASDPETPKAATSPKAPATRTAEPRPDIAPSAPKPAVPEPTPPAAAPAPADNQTGRHQVLMEGFASRQDAQKTAESLKAQGYKPIVRESNGKAVVQLGTFSNRTNAQSLAEKTGARVQSQTAPNP